MSSNNGFLVGSWSRLGLNYSSYQLNTQKTEGNDPRQQVQTIKKPSALPAGAGTVLLQDWPKILRLFKDSSEPKVNHAYLVSNKTDYCSDQLLTKNTTGELAIDGVTVEVISPDTGQAIAQVEEHCHREKIKDAQKALLLKWNDSGFHTIAIEHQPGTLKQTQLKKINSDFREGDMQIYRLKEKIAAMQDCRDKITESKVNFATLIKDPDEFIAAIISPLVAVINKYFNADTASAKTPEFTALMQFLDGFITGTKPPPVTENEALLSSNIQNLSEIFNLKDSNLAPRIIAFVTKLIEQELQAISRSLLVDLNKIFIDPIGIFDIKQIREILTQVFSKASSLVMESHDQGKRAEPGNFYISKWNDVQNASFFKNTSGALAIATLHQKDLLNSKA